MDYLVLKFFPKLVESNEMVKNSYVIVSQRFQTSIQYQAEQLSSVKGDIRISFSPMPNTILKIATIAIFMPSNSRKRRIENRKAFI